MEFRKVLALRGPNIWANFPVLEAWVDLGELKDRLSHEIPGFNDRVMSWLPTMVEHRCSIGERGGFFEQLRRGTYLAHVLQHVTLEMLSLAGTNVGFGRARETSEAGVYKVVVEYEEETLAKETLVAARELCLAAVHGHAYDVSTTLDRLRDIAQQFCLGPSTRSIVMAAQQRGIPVRRLNTGSLVQFGYGVRQRRIQAAETDRTGAIAQDIAQDKELTRMFLRSVGVASAEGRPVNNAEDACAAAEAIGYPVVVKPQYGNQGRGVAAKLMTREQVMAAYDPALREGGPVLVEKYAPGNDYRVLVVGGRVVAAARREPAHVVGDGVHTITQLVELVNTDPRRGEHHGTMLSKIHVDDIGMAVLAEQGMTPESIPPSGMTVFIRRNANLSTGGTAIDVTDRVHPEVAARAVEAARVIGLDIAGIDILATDISRPLEEQGAIVVEVNACPGLRMHLQPSAGVSRPVGEAIVSMLYPEGETGRIPVVAVTGVNGKTTTVRFISHILKQAGKLVGMTCTDGIYVGDRRIDTGDCSGPQSAQAVLMNPGVEAAVLETARGGILRAGLGFDRCDVAVVTNIGEGDHLGLSDVDTAESLAKVKRTIVEVVSPKGAAVLNANDPLVAAMAQHCPGSVIFFALDGNHSVVARHRSSGGKAIFVRDNHIVLAEGDREEALLSLDHVPLTYGGHVTFEVENAMMAIAAAWSLGIAPEVICAAAMSFANDLDRVPGRFNMFEINKATVIVDYGHNASAILAVVQAIDKLPHSHRVVAYTAAGDRRDCDMIRQGQVLGEAFDRVILHEDHYKRGRADGEIIALLRKGLALGKRVKEIQEVGGAIPAVELALKSAKPGDLVLVQADTIDETVDYLRAYLKSLTVAEKLPLAEPVKKSAEEKEVLTAGVHATPPASDRAAEVSKISA